MKSPNPRKNKTAHGPRFLIDYDQVLALSAYVTARLLLYKDSRSWDKKSIDWITDLIQRGNSVPPNCPNPPPKPPQKPPPNCPGSDPKPPRTIEAVAEDIFFKLLFDPEVANDTRSACRRSNNRARRNKTDHRPVERIDTRR